MNDTDIESKAAKLYSIWLAVDGFEVTPDAWEMLPSNEQEAWRAVARYVLTNES